MAYRIDAKTPKAESVKRIKREIREDMASGLIPSSVASFGALHDYVDANEYGGFCDDLGYDGFSSWAAFIDFVNAVQAEVDAWLAASA